MAAAGARIRVPVAVALRVLGLSRQGYYDWLSDPVSQRDWDDAHVIDKLYDLHNEDATLGYRFLTDELELVHVLKVGENRVHRLCHIAGITASHHKKRSKPGSTGPAPHDDLLAILDKHGVVRHEFKADRPNQVWLWDISEHPTREGKLYICAIKDVCSGRIVGYSTDSRMTASLAMAAMRNAIGLRSPVGTIVHSDRGGQFRAKRVQRLLANNGLRGRWAAPTAPVKTPAWNRSSRCSRRTSSTPADGTPAKTCVWRWSPGSKPSTTAGTVNVASGSSPRSSLR
jgi:hypothetical protein